MPSGNRGRGERLPPLPKQNALPRAFPTGRFGGDALRGVPVCEALKGEAPTYTQHGGPNERKTSMNDHVAVVADAEQSLDALAAELTVAAYTVALRYAVGDRWLDLELELWRALTEAVEKWGQ